MDWCPQAPLTAFQACHRFLFLVFVKRHAFVKKVRFCQYVLMCRFCTCLGKHQIDAELIHFLAEIVDFVLSSHPDPIADRNDVQ